MPVAVAFITRRAYCVASLENLELATNRTWVARVNANKPTSLANVLQPNDGAWRVLALNLPSRRHGTEDAFQQRVHLGLGSLPPADET